MVEATTQGQDDLRAMISQVKIQQVPDQSQMGKPAETIEALEALKKSKGKAMSDNPKQVPAEVKAISGRAQADDPENGFVGAKFEGKKTGKAKQYYLDGSFYDGFMLEDNLVKGRFYFANGDFFQGTFKDNRPLLGSYIQNEGTFSCEQTSFENGLPSGPMEKAQKCTLTHDGKKVSLTGTFANGKPTGEVTMSSDAGTVTLQSPFDGSAEAEPAQEEKKEVEAPVAEPETPVAEPVAEPIVVEEVKVEEPIEAPVVEEKKVENAP